jgi:hypothetical protein
MASMLKSVDESFGRVLAALDRLGLRENARVIFGSDNGGNTQSNTSADGKAGKRKAAGRTPFLGTARYKFTGSAELRLRLKTASGGVAAVRWRKADQAEFDPAAQVAKVGIPVSADWQEVAVKVPATGEVAQLRRYLPADKGAIEVATVQVIPDTT